MPIISSSDKPPINWEDFVDRFKPTPHREEYDGFLFETYGEDLQKIEDADPQKVWTILECDGVTSIASGRHRVNRMGFILCEVGYTGPTHDFVDDDYHQVECTSDAEGQV